MRSKVLLVLVATVFLAVATLILPTMVNANCAGQGMLVNNGPYIAEIVSINDSKWHQDVPPWSSAIYHIDYNQPVQFTLYRAGYLEKYLASAKVLPGCSFAEDQRVVINGSRLESITWPSGFAPYFAPYDAGW